MTKKFKQFTLLASRTFTSCCKLNSNDNRKIHFLDIKPVVKYENANVNKAKILADNRNKSGVYRWINKKNGKTYVGSSIDIRKRL